MFTPITGESVITTRPVQEYAVGVDVLRHCKASPGECPEGQAWTLPPLLAVSTLAWTHSVEPTPALL